MATSPSGRPSWQRNSAFKFFSSIKLAVVLLAVLIVAAIAGTLYESTFDAKVARAYVYGAPWFNFWLLLLVANLTASALSRWPWRKHHVAFLITHLGIITLLFGSLIGRIWGVEGTMTIFKGDQPSNRLLIDQHQLRVRDTDGIVKGYPAEFINHPPTPDRPRNLGALASGARLSIVEYAPAVEGKLNPKPLESGGAPALHFTISTAMMGQKLESWLMADEQEHSSFNMGLATIELKRGTAPAADATPEGPAAAASPAAAAEADLEETIFAFAKSPDQQVSKPAKGGSTGAKVVLTQPENGNKGSVVIKLGEQSWTHDVAAHLGQETPLEGSPFTMRMEAYWPDFRIDNGKPVSVSEQPNNPAVVVTLRGRGVPAAPVADAHAGRDDAAAAGGPNRLTLFIADDGSVTYDLASRKQGRSTGKLEPNAPLPTGWADWALVMDQTMPHAEAWNDFQPIAAPATAANLPDGVRIRVQQGDKSIEQWIPAGWQIGVPISPAPIQVAFGWQQFQLPIALELMEFEVQRNEGSDSPAGFKSTVRVTDREGGSAIGQCWMNNPFSYPGGWWRAWTGMTYKMSQASWNPENLGQSTIQILRDPGWLLKWVGSILICSGIFLLFYVKQFRRPAS
ncbi:MAG: cytochrome c biogenesis protein ResB, partial [Verrucomicrobiota bacterium]|nr:cytochrome c biogenesis protein ResB [Verrucomicrobiota bacterium]